MKFFFFVLSWAVCFIMQAFGAPVIRNLRIAGLFADHMVLQQKTNVCIWGWAVPGREVSVIGSWGDRATAKVNLQGKWITHLKTCKAGGPYSIYVKSVSDVITIQDVMIGEVWLASGQSNMDIPLSGWPPGDTILSSKQEIIQANYPLIRFFQVPFNTAANPLDSVRAIWTESNPKTAAKYSATAYFYARKLYQELKVPIGIIQSSIGGTPAEAWTSEPGLERSGEFKDEIRKLKSLQQTLNDWLKMWPVQAIPTSDQNWKTIKFSDDLASTPSLNDNQWATIKIPGRVDLLPSGEFDGALWIRRYIAIQDTTTDYTLNIGSIDDMDATYINGKYIGGLIGSGFANSPRKIRVPKSDLVKGQNLIAIRVIDSGGQGFVRGPINLTGHIGDTIALDGLWKSRLVAEMIKNKIYVYGLNAPLDGRPNMNQINSNSPTVLFNAMINPLIPYTIKGIIWYQGESNVGRSEQYKTLFPSLIRDWRCHWNSELPFYFVQIAPFLYSAPDQKEQSQKLRDAQRYGLKLPKRGMVTTLDIGYLKTAHPPFKQEVGKRLANFALKNQYGHSELAASGPLFRNASLSGNKLILEFDETGQGLISAENGLNNFEIAGENRIFLKAEASIRNNRVIVSNPSISKPVYVRYAWCDGCEATLFNKAGLPAATFTSEN